MSDTWAGVIFLGTLILALALAQHARVAVHSTAYTLPLESGCEFINGKRLVQIIGSPPMHG